jgi:trans-feruloyl-CoA hydratase/vanillin synthase
MNAFETLLIDKQDAIATVVLNRPAKRNAMSPQLHREMTEVLEQLRADSTVKAVVLTGSGNVFCAGMDLKEFFIELKDDPIAYEAVWKSAVEWRGKTLRYFPKPVIAMVNGFCFGGAFSIVEGCDLAFAADDAVFGLSEINFKLFPGGCVSKSLANLMRPRDALYYGMTGDTFNGTLAAEIGFINKAFPREQLVEQTMAIARKIAAKDAHALRATKEGYRYSLEMTWEAAMNYAMAKELELVQRQNDSWRKEGISDFLQGKYKPGLETHPG